MTNLIAQLFAEASTEANLTAEAQELIARRLNEACEELFEEHDAYTFMSEANAR